MNLKKLVMMLCLIALGAGAVSAKTLLQKTLYFDNPQTGKIDSAKYWKIYTGNYSATLERKFPGEDSMPVNTELNITLLSSGYLEGYGYTRKGRVDCMAWFMLDNKGAVLKLSLDSIDFIIENGALVKPRSGQLAGLFVDVEGNKVLLTKRMTLTRYKLLTDYEERNLKPDGEFVINYFAFSKPALAAAQKAAKEREAAAATPSDSGAAK
jgi:hypothetical protein